MYAAKFYRMRGDPWFGEKLVKSVASVIKAVPGVAKLARVIPGVGTVMGIADIGVSAAKGLIGSRKPVTPGLGQAFKMGAMGTAPGGGFAELARTFAPAAGAIGQAIGAFAGARPRIVGRRRYRRINPLNPRAARRAISRIKQLRKLTRSIESQLPKRAAKASTSRKK